jgi:multiple antibiotic resistance protein
MARAVELFFIYAIQLFIIVDPIAAIPVFMAITQHRSRTERRRVAARSCAIASVVIILFIVAGARILGYFGIDLTAVRIGGGILLFIIALELIYGQLTRSEISGNEEKMAESKEDVSVTPLAIPLLAGPGAIATSLIFSGRADTFVEMGGLCAGASVVFGLTYLALNSADRIYRVVGALGMTVFMRIMGLLLAFISVQYIIDGVSGLLER